MSQWRREASEQIPELQRIISSQLVDNPMMLWIELNQEFERLCEKEPPPLDLLARVWQYCYWCMVNGNGDVRTAAALGFCEHLIDTPKRTALLPKIMKRSEFHEVKNLLEYHNTPDEIASRTDSLWQ